MLLYSAVQKTSLIILCTLTDKTGLPNRAMCVLRFEKYAADKLKDSFVFLLIKLDNLKYVNDKGGREAGDALFESIR